MKKRWLINLVLLSLLAGVFLFIRYQDQRDYKEYAEHRLSKQIQQDIKQIRFSYSKADGSLQQYVFARETTENDDWLMQKPAYALANAVRIKHLLSFLHERVRVRYPTDDKDLADFGLKPAKISIEYNDELFRLGDLNQASKQRYVLHNDQINMVSESISGTIMSSHAGLVAHKVIPLQDEVIALHDDTTKLGIKPQRLTGINAISVADYTDDETVLGSFAVVLDKGVTLLFEQLETDNDKLIMLGRPDLQVKYELDKVQLLQ